MQWDTDYVTNRHSTYLHVTKILTGTSCNNITWYWHICRTLHIIMMFSWKPSCTCTSNNYSPTIRRRETQKIDCNMAKLRCSRENRFRHTHTRARSQTHTRARARAHKHTRTQHIHIIHTLWHTHTLQHTHTHTHTPTHPHTHTHMWKHTHTHTHTHKECYDTKKRNSEKSKTKKYPAME